MPISPGTRLAGAGPAAVNGGLRALGPDGLGQHEGGAAGCVNLPVVVHLQNFHVSLGEKANGVLYQAAQNGNPQAHVTGVKEGNLLAAARMWARSSSVWPVVPTTRGSLWDTA